LHPFSPLAPGAKVAVIAPASPAPKDRFAAGLALLAERYAVQCVYDPARAKRPALAYLAEDDRTRAAAFNAALNDEESQAIFCARGGYGAARILDDLDSEALKRRRIPIVGFSDITAIHAWALLADVATVHGPVITQLADLDPSDHQALFSLLEGELPTPFTGLDPLCAGRARGKLIGGNLSLLASLCGTRFLPTALLQNTVLLLEDVDEAPYRVDRLLTQLGQAGVFAALSGIVLGDFTRCDRKQGHPQVDVQAKTVLRDRLADLGLPVASGLPIGHGGKNRALPLGLEVVLDADAGTLSWS